MENDMLSSLLSDPEALQNAVKPEKRALLGALKPFVAEEVSGQFDRALRLVSMARMARAALGQVNLSADDTAPRAL